jgi:NADH:ubiquinone oxidoreductase subunit 3 (subunit A)
VADKSITKAEIVKALLKEYLSARQEVILHVQIYKTQYRNVGIITAIAGLLVPLVIGHIPIPGTSVPYTVTGWVAILIVFTISCAAILITFSVLAAVFAMQALGVRCERLETQINKCLGGKYLIWEHLAVPRIWGAGEQALKNPDSGALVFYYIFMFLFVIVMPSVVVTKVLCSDPDIYLYVASVVYIWLSIVCCLYAGYVNAYTIGGRFRSDVRQMLEPIWSGEGKGLTFTSIRPLMLIGLVVVPITYGIIVLSTRPGVCGYVGRLTPSTASPDQIPWSLEQS